MMVSGRYLIAGYLDPLSIYMLKHAVSITCILGVLRIGKFRHVRWNRNMPTCAEWTSRTLME